MRSKGHMHAAELLGSGRKDKAQAPIKSSRLNPIGSCYILSLTLYVLIQILAFIKFMVLGQADDMTT